MKYILNIEVHLAGYIYMYIIISTFMGMKQQNVGRSSSETFIPVSNTNGSCMVKFMFQCISHDLHW